MPGKAINRNPLILLGNGGLGPTRRIDKRGLRRHGRLARSDLDCVHYGMGRALIVTCRARLRFE